MEQLAKPTCNILHSKSSVAGVIKSWEEINFTRIGHKMYWIVSYLLLTHLPPGQNGWHFADDISKCIFMNKKVCILIRIPLKFVPNGPIDNKSALVQVMA